MATTEDLGKELAALKEIISDLQLPIATLKDENKMLEEKMTGMTPKESTEIKIDKKDLPRPEVFQGDRSKYHEWEDSLMDLLGTYGQDFTMMAKWALTQKGNTNESNDAASRKATSRRASMPPLKIMIALRTHRTHRTHRT